MADAPARASRRRGGGRLEKPKRVKRVKKRARPARPGARAVAKPAAGSRAKHAAAKRKRVAGAKRARGRGGGRVAPAGAPAAAAKEPSARKGRKRRRRGPRVHADIPLEEDARALCEYLMIEPRHIARIRSVFEQIDFDGSGEVDYDEFFEYIGDLRTKFSDALFSRIDEIGKGSVNFSEFVQIVANYCMYTKDDVLKFAFETFDKDKSGTIDENEFMVLANTVNNASPMFPGNFARALEEFDRNSDGLIDFDEFKLINRRYPMVFYPAFRLQDRMQKRILGARTWAKIMAARQKHVAEEEYRALHGGLPPPKSRGCLGAIAAMFGGRRKVYEPEEAVRKMMDVEDDLSDSDEDEDGDEKMMEAAAGRRKPPSSASKSGLRLDGVAKKAPASASMVVKKAPRKRSREKPVSAKSAGRLAVKGR
eukprot:PLAT3679.17.p1 GENE.PLAT3679.17~~PLAT3679.17.p1  ORF type:complete len:441 (+),score=146.00 PLAT3679.17:55-1323(+)